MIRTTALFVIWVLSGCAQAPVAIDSAEPVGQLPITVIDRGWHTDIALPADVVTGPVASLKQAFPGVRFLVFGFGNRGYYMAQDDTSMSSVTALFPGPGVILITALKSSPAEAFKTDEVISVRLSAEQMAAVTDYLQRALAAHPDGSLQRIADGPYPGSAFYATNETYTVFHTCNTWTLGALRSGNLPVDPDGVIFAGGVMEQVRKIAAQQQLRDASH